MTDSAPPQVRQIRLGRTFAWAGVLLGADAFLLNQGAISALVGSWMVLVSAV